MVSFRHLQTPIEWSGGVNAVAGLPNCQSQFELECRGQSRQSMERRNKEDKQYMRSIGQIVN